MRQASGKQYPAGQDARFRPALMRPASIASGDATLVSMTKVELHRLLGIEAAAQTALHALNGPRTADAGELAAAAEALDVALHMPVFGG